MQSESRSLIILATGLCGYAALFIAASLARLYQLHSNLGDLGVFDQFLWLMLHGQHPFSTIEHFSPILYALLPIYAIFPHPETLLILNVLLITSGAIPLYLIARHWQFPPHLAAIWCITFLVNPFVTSAVIFDFHELSIAVPLVGFALYTIATRRRALLFCLSFLLLLCKENFGVSLVGFGLLWAILYRDWRCGLALSMLGIAAFWAELTIFLPAFSGRSFMSDANVGQVRFSWIFSPSFLTKDYVLYLLVGDAVYIGTLLILFCGLPLYAFAWMLPAGSDIALNMLSLGAIMRSLFSYHNLIVTLVLVAAAMRGTVKLSRKHSQITLTYVVMVINLIIGYALAPLPLPYTTNLWEIRWEALADPDRADITALQAMVPPGKTVSLQSNVGVFFSGRPQFEHFPNIGDSEAILLHLRHPFHHSRVIFGSPYENPDYFNVMEAILQDPQWHIAYWHNDWLLLEKHAPDIDVDRHDIKQALAAMKADYFSISPYAHP